MKEFIPAASVLPTDTFILTSYVVVSRKLSFLKLKRYQAVNVSLDGEL